MSKNQRLKPRAVKPLKQVVVVKKVKVRKPRVGRQRNIVEESKTREPRSTRVPIGVSMVNDGVNTGSVWKNTTAERVTFPLAREKFSDLTSTGTTFQLLEQLYVNPGNQALFPVFSEIAKVYEEYVPNVLRIYYRTKEYTASGSVVSAGLGAMAVNFDANDANFGNMTSLENYEHSISGAPFSGIMCLDVLEMHRRRFKGKARDLALNNYYVNYADNSIGPSTDQAKWYDVGNFQFAVDGTQAGVIGELWIEYSFTMIRRKSPENGSGGFLMAHLEGYADDATDAAELGLTPFTSTAVAAMSTLSTVDMANNLAGYSATTIGLNDASDSVINLPNSNSTWLVNVTWTGAATIAAAPTASAAGGATALSIWGPVGAASGPQFFAAGGTTAASTIIATTTLTAIPTSSTNQITYGGLTGMTSGNLDYWIVRIPNSIGRVLKSANVENRLELIEKFLRQHRDEGYVVCREEEKSSSAAAAAASSTPMPRPPQSSTPKSWF